MSATDTPHHSLKYDPSYPELAYKYALLGATQERLATLFDVNPSTIRDWRSRYPAFDKAIKRGGKEADATVAHALYRKAVGYDRIFTKRTLNPDGSEFVTTEEKHYPPDTGACIQWLKCRSQRDDESIWNYKEEGEEKQKLEFDDIEVARKIAFILAKAVYGETLDGEAKQLKDRRSLL